MPFAFVHLHAVALVDVHETPARPCWIFVGFNEIKTAQAQFLEAHDHAFIERCIDGEHIRLQNNSVCDRDARPVRGNEDLSSQQQPFLQLGGGVGPLGHVRAPDKDSLGIALDERVESKISLGDTQGSLG